MSIRTSKAERKLNVEPSKFTESFLEIRAKVLPLLIKHGYLESNLEFLEKNGVYLESSILSETEKVELSLTILRSLEESKIVTRVGSADKWLLTAPLGGEGQNLNIGLNTAISIANTINSYREAMKIEREFCDPLSLTERDLQNLAQVCHNLSESLAKGGTGDN
jgi:hypothetical protein